MPITVLDSIAERGKADAKRHRDKQREAIIKQLPEIISEQAIITKRGKRIVRIPIRGIQIPVFKHGKSQEQGGGIGQGKEGVGDILRRRPGTGGKPGAAGTEPGVDYIETEVEIEELIGMMLKDLGLPRLQKKNVRQIAVKLGFRIHGTQRTGPPPLLNKPKTAKEGARRFFATLTALQEESGKDELECFLALEKTDGFFEDALRLLRKDLIARDEAREIAPFPIYHTDGLRYHRIEPNITLRSRAVVFALMDVSGSMTIDKKYFARSMLFWLVGFLRELYEQVEIRFIVHHATAHFVKESEFFSTGESGGTVCASAYNLVNDTIESEYPKSQWNIYVWHSSDGDDADHDAAVTEVEALFKRDINMFGYCEITPGTNVRAPPSSLLKAFDQAFDLIEKPEGNLMIRASRNGKIPFLGVRLLQKEDIHPAIRAFLKQDRFVEK